MWNSSVSSCKNYLPIVPSFFFLQTKSRIQKIPKPKGSVMEVQRAKVEIGPLPMVVMIVEGRAKEARSWKFREQREWKFSPSWFPSSGAIAAVRIEGFGLGRSGFVGVANLGLLLLRCFWVGCCFVVFLASPFFFFFFSELLVCFVL